MFYESHAIQYRALMQALLVSSVIMMNIRTINFMSDPLSGFLIVVPNRDGNNTYFSIILRIFLLNGKNV